MNVSCIAFNPLRQTNLLQSLILTTAYTDLTSPMHRECPVQVECCRDQSQMAEGLRSVAQLFTRARDLF